MAHFQRAMMMDVDQSAKAMKNAEMEAEIEGLPRRLQAAHLPRHAGQWGAGAGRVKPARLEWDVVTIVAHTSPNLNAI